MPRQERTKSGTGIYHVMLRGINRQDIFEDAEDYLQMVACLRMITEPSPGSSRNGAKNCRGAAEYRRFIGKDTKFLLFRKSQGAFL